VSTATGSIVTTGEVLNRQAAREERPFCLPTCGECDSSGALAALLEQAPWTIRNNDPVPLKINGNTHGLAPSELRSLERLFQRSVEKDEIVSLPLAREMCRLAEGLSRRIGVLISREGRIVEVFLGTREILYLPDLGRYRLGRGRLRRLRLVFTDLSAADHAVLPPDIIGDLQKLRLDAVVGVKEQGNRTLTTWAAMLPGGSGEQVERIEDLGRRELDFDRFITEREEELVRSEAGSVETARDRAVLVGVYAASAQAAESSMLELRELARTAGVHIADVVIQRRQPDPRTVLGRGKLEEVVLRCLRLGAELLIFDQELKPGQWRAITNSTELKVLDRSMLILDIFAQRARSSDGRLQVELAQLKYNLPRLVEKDTGLSRLTGGIGGRGPGETKLEIGRRRIRDRIADLERRIDKLGEQRDLRRRRRKETPLPLVAILGYTNVGKSTLFNALTRSDVLAENKLFATLDPAQRRLVLPPLAEDPPWPPRAVVLSDTVGFIRELPAELASAFRATLEEIREAALVMHVVDISDPECAAKMAAVDRTLREMEVLDIPRILVLNKADLIPPEEAALRARELGGILVSAVGRSGFAAIHDAIRSHLFGAASMATPAPEEGEGEEKEKQKETEAGTEERRSALDSAANPGRG